MARTIDEIKLGLTTSFIENTTLQSVYGLDTSKTFAEQFTKVSIENILLYVIAVAIYALEVIFDNHVSEVDTLISNQSPHTLKWYVYKVLDYREGQVLVEDTDYYSDVKDDGTTYSDEEIEVTQIVKYASAVEDDGVLYIKVAGDDGSGNKEPLSDEQLIGLTSYVKEVKDAGVSVDFINEAGAYLRLELDIYYNPQILNANGEDASGDKVINNAIEEYITSLDFNGEYRNITLVDKLQAVSGVEIPELKLAEQSYGGVSYETVNAFVVPRPGYYQFNEDLITINYIAYN